MGNPTLNEPDKVVTPDGAQQRAFSFESFILTKLASLKFALVVVLLLALACVAGTLIPQGSEVNSYLARHPDSLRLMEILSALGLTSVYHAWWFVGLLFTFAATLLACTFRRYNLIRHTTGARRIKLIGSFITHVSLILVLTGGLVRVLWGQKGVITLNEGESVQKLMGTDGGVIELPFTVRLIDFELEFHESKPLPAGTDKLYVKWADKQLQFDFPITLNVAHPVVPSDAPQNAEPPFKVSILRYVPDFVFDGSGGGVSSRSETPNNPAVQVSVTDGNNTTNQLWVFARFPDFNTQNTTAEMPLSFRFESAQSQRSNTRGKSIKAFKSTLEFLEDDVITCTQTIAVNSPFTYHGYTFYQTNYNPDDLTWSALQVVKDPGVPIVYGGFILMMLGLTMVFWLNPRQDTIDHKKGELS